MSLDDDLERRIARLERWARGTDEQLELQRKTNGELAEAITNIADAINGDDQGDDDDDQGDDDDDGQGG